MAPAWSVVTGILLWCAGSGPAWGQEVETPRESLARYFAAETARLELACLTDVGSLEDWRGQREEYQRQLLEMLGLWPMPARSNLQPVVTGRLEEEGFAVEKLHFQSMPGLYVTANLYLPKSSGAPLPAVLYVCGHALVKTNGVSYGNKTAYQHHGIWFARHGIVCLTIDTVQLGEIEGLHHGTYREGMWWWNSRGYTPAGVEAWNAIRALDLLQTRPEVDRERIGMTGRSGGGAYTWTTAALDDRVKVAAPVAGITDLRNHVVDGCVEGHCDCMFPVNTYQWDHPLMAALVAPRPLLIVNTDSDGIFPLDGVVRTHAKVRSIYALYGVPENLGLVIGPGPHKDTQDLQVPVFRWFIRHLKGEDPLIQNAAVKSIHPQALKVFDVLPADSINAQVQETFVPPAGSGPGPGADVLDRLKEQCFGGWPNELGPALPNTVIERQVQGLRLRIIEFESQPNVRLRLFVAEPTRGRRVDRTVLEVLDAARWASWKAGVGEAFDAAANGITKKPNLSRSDTENLSTLLGSLSNELRTSRTRRAWFAPRGIGPSAWEATDREQVQIRRRFMLLGQTLDGMRVWDVRRAVDAYRQWERRRTTRLIVSGSGVMGVNALYAGLFEPRIDELHLSELPASHRQGPDYLNVLKILDIPQALELAGDRAQSAVSPDAPAKQL